MPDFRTNKVKTDDDAELILVLAESKKGLIEYIDSRIGKDKTFDPYLYLANKNCGCTYSFKTKDDLPEESLTCSHGNKIIKYTEKEV